jgi:hypothetical protein
MTYEDRRVVTEPAETETVVPATERVVREPRTVVEERAPMRQTVVHDDPVGNAYAASQLIGTIVWAIVVLVLLVVALWALHVYAGLF